MGSRAVIYFACSAKPDKNGWGKPYIAVSITLSHTVYRSHKKILSNSMFLCGKLDLIDGKFSYVKLYRDDLVVYVIRPQTRVASSVS